MGLDVVDPTESRVSNIVDLKKRRQKELAVASITTWETDRSDRVWNLVGEPGLDTYCTGR